MDLVSSIRKSGSRGGVDFKWEDVASSNHRENYLGHSLMAPVGRWQKGRDLNWYAKGDNTADANSSETPEERADRERKEEIRKIKEREDEALARALGLPLPQKNATGANAIAVPGQPEQAPEKDEKPKGRDATEAAATAVIGAAMTAIVTAEILTDRAITPDTTANIGEGPEVIITTTERKARMAGAEDIIIATTSVDATVAARVPGAKIPEDIGTVTGAESERAARIADPWKETSAGEAEAHIGVPAIVPGRGQSPMLNGDYVVF